MFLLDSLLIGGLRFVLDKVAAVADGELNDDTALREHLLAAQMRVELGEMTQAEFEVLEADILQRLREIRERQLGQQEGPVSGDYTVTGIDVSFDDEDESSRS
jgi:hypothetical protein